MPKQIENDELTWWMMNETMSYYVNVTEIHEAKIWWMNANQNHLIDNSESYEKSFKTLVLKIIQKKLFVVKIKF